MNGTQVIRSFIINSILQGLTDEQIAKELQLKLSKIKQYYTNGTVPKRKTVISYIICYHLALIGEQSTQSEIPTKLISSYLNATGITNTVGNEWNTQRVIAFLQKQGIRSKKTVTKDQLISLSVTPQEFYDTFGTSEPYVKIDDYYRELVVPTDVLNYSEPVSDPSDFLKEMKVGILKAIDNGCGTGAEITKYLNDNGFTNKAGNKVGRWSVKLYLEQLNIEIPTKKRDWGNADRQYLMQKISEYAESKEIPNEQMDKWVSELESDGDHIINKNELLSTVSHLRLRHNRIAKDYKFYKEWFPKIDYFVNVTLRHKLASREDIAKHFGFTTMTAQRYLKRLEYNVEHQYYLRFKITLESYLDQTKGEEWSATKCAEWFNNTYLKTERDREWTYLIIQFSINKLYDLEDQGLLYNVGASDEKRIARSTI
jgi:hypothetical protein